jgi:hypothetical protein
MSTKWTVEVPAHFRRCGRGSRKEMRPGVVAAPVPPGRVPRVARLMALALRFEEFVRTGQVASYSALASLGHVPRARFSQIVRLLHLAPGSQERTSTNQRQINHPENSVDQLPGESTAI